MLKINPEKACENCPNRDPIWGQKLQQWRSQRAHTYFLCACWLYAVPRSQNGSQNDPKIDSKRVPTSMFFRNMFVHFFVMFMFNLASRPGRLLFFFVVKSNSNKKDRQGKATQEKTQDQTSPRQDQTDRTEQAETRQDKTKKRPFQNSLLGVQMLVLGPQRYFWVSIIASFTIVAPVFWVSIIARTLVAPSWVQVGPRLLYWCRGCQGGPKFASSRSMPLRFIRNATPNHFGGPKWGQNKDA